MQAPLSSTASGQQLRTGPLPGLLSSNHSRSPREFAQAEHTRRNEGRRLRDHVPPAMSDDLAGASLTFGDDIPVAEHTGLAHDAGNLLGALRLYCDLLARPGVLRDEHRHYADELQLLSRRSGSLVDRLLNPEGTERREATVTSAPSVSVPLVVEQCRGLLSTIARRAVEVVYGAGSEAPVPVAQEAVERILVNLIKNAAEASAGGGAITLRVRRLREQGNGSRRGTFHTGDSSRSCIVLSVEDHGNGMSVAAAKVLLEGNTRMHQVEVDPVQAEEQLQQLQGLGLVSSKGPGRGLGLRVVRELVEASGGELRLRSRSGCGTTIEIAWGLAGYPCVENPCLEDDDEGERQAVPSGTQTTEDATFGVLGRVSC